MKILLFQEIISVAQTMIKLSRPYNRKKFLCKNGSFIFVIEFQEPTMPLNESVHRSLYNSKTKNIILSNNLTNALLWKVEKWISHRFTRQ